MNNVQMPLDLVYGAPAMRGDNFVMSHSNREAVEYLQRYPEWPTPGLVLYGDAGVGKTHMVHAWGQKHAAIEIASAADIADYLAADCLQPVVIDGAAAFCADAARAEQLFFLYQRLMDNGAKLLLIDRLPPQQWQIPLADLASRLRALPAVRVDGPDDELVQNLLLKYFSDRGIAADPAVIDYLLPRVPRSGPELQALVADMDRDSLQMQRKLTLAGVRAYCKEKLGK